MERYSAPYLASKGQFECRSGRSASAGVPTLKSVQYGDNVTNLFRNHRIHYGPLFRFPCDGFWYGLPWHPRGLAGTIPSRTRMIATRAIPKRFEESSLLFGFDGRQRHSHRWIVSRWLV